MSMGMGMSFSMRQVQDLRMVQALTHTTVQWSLISAYKNNGWGPPPYVEPEFEKEVFEPRIKLKVQRIANFESLDHVARMKLVDEANEVFRFDYRRGLNCYDEERYFYKVPLLRNHDAEPVDIAVRISQAEYERATAILQAVGEMDRIARAIPYYGLCKTVVKHLRQFKVGLDQTVLVSVDRGGRLPCIILMRALGLATMYSLKVDQGGGQLDEDRLKKFARKNRLQGKHVLFVDSTVDSGRQIRALQRYFDNPEWQCRLGHQSWSIIGSNDRARSVDEHHQDVNWGVDPDTTFEDDPELMGIDYAQGSHTKVVECPSEASEAIRKCLTAVPDGYIYSADDIDEQIAKQLTKWKERQRERRAAHKKEVAAGRASHHEEVVAYRLEQARITADEKFERKLERIVASKRWQKLRATHQELPTETLPASVQNGTAHVLHNVLIVGSGSQDLPPSSAQFVAEALGPHCSFFAGTPLGNPGAVLKAVLQSVAQPEVRLYQPKYMEQKRESMFGDVPVMFVGPEKKDMRRQMIADSHVVLTLGGTEGTLREVLLAISLCKPTVIIKGYGPVPTYVLGTKRLREQAHVKTCQGLAEAVQTILDLSKV